MDKENVKRTNMMLMKVAVVLCFIAVVAGVIAAIDSMNENGNIQSTDAAGANEEVDAQASADTQEINSTEPVEENPEEIEESDPLPTQNAAPASSSCGGKCGSPSCGAKTGGSCGCGR